MNAIDTNVFVYSADHNEPAKKAVAEKLLIELANSAQPTIVPRQVVAEFLCCLRRWQSKERVSQADVSETIKRMMRLFPVAMPSLATVDRSLYLIERYQISHWDRMLLAACIDAGVNTLYSEDLQDDMIDDSVKVVNPFL